MKAITTKYLGATNTRSARIKASAPDNGSLTLPWGYELNTEPNHAAAARAFADKRGWKGRLVTGYIGNGVYAHVFTE